MGRPDAALVDIEAVHLYDPADAEMLPYSAAPYEALTGTHMGDRQEP